MKMRKSITTTILALLAAVGCKESRTLYSDAEYVMFADTNRIEMIGRDARSFTVPVASTVACDYDRNFGVEVVDAKSTAIERRDYTLESNTVTIKAGERVGHLKVTANWEAMSATDTLQIAFRLVMPESVKWDLYGDETKVRMVKTCPWSIEDDFSGWCMVTSMFIYNYPGTNTSMQRLIYTEAHPVEKNTLILHNFLYDGYDVNIRFKDDDPSKPWITVDDDQILSDEQSVFGIAYGDNHILVGNNPLLQSSFNGCGGYATVYISVYVADMDELVGYVTDNGDPNMCLNILEWVTDEEADRIEREDGLKKSY